MTPAVIFDLDGPLLDVRRRYGAVFAEAVRRLGGRPPAGDDWALRRAGLGRPARLAAAGITGREAEFTRIWLERIEAPDMLALDRVQPHAAAVLDRLTRRAGPPVLVTFRRDAAALARQLADLGLAGRFAAIASGPDPGGDKAAGKVALLAGLGLRGPLTGWFVGDTPADLEAGRRLGLATCAVAYGLTPADRLPGADRLCPTPADLLAWAGDPA